MFFHSVAIGFVGCLQFAQEYQGHCCDKKHIDSYRSPPSGIGDKKLIDQMTVIATPEVVRRHGVCDETGKYRQGDGCQQTFIGKIPEFHASESDKRYSESPDIKYQYERSYAEPLR